MTQASRGKHMGAGLKGRQPSESDRIAALSAQPLTDHRHNLDSLFSLCGVIKHYTEVTHFICKSIYA